jgi:hypothetical protein
LDRDLDGHKASTCTEQNKDKKNTDMHPQENEDSKLATEMLVFMKVSILEYMEELPLKCYFSRLGVP